MGITIHWYLGSREEEREAAAAKLRRVRQACLTLPFKEIGDVEYIPPSVCRLGLADLKDATFDRRLRWALLQSWNNVTASGYAQIKPLEVLRLPLRADEGCEPTNLMLARYPHKEGWSSWAFTKTQYATHFLDAHLLVIAALDACDEVGILESVSDEGGYWDTRDLEVLAGRLNASTNLIAGVFGSLKSRLGNKVASPIETGRNYMRVLHKGTG